MTRLTVLSCCFGIALLGTAHGQVASRGDTSDIANAVEGFHRAVAQGDRMAAMGWLAPDAVILENGEAQTREEYGRGHIQEDIVFNKAVPSNRSRSTIHMEGTVAWTMATSKTVGNFKGRAIDSEGTELMVLTHTASGWRIRAIHWSNHAIRAK